MSALRRALGRKEALLAVIVLAILGGLIGRKVLIRSASAQTDLGASDEARVVALLDAGRYKEALAELDAIAVQSGEGPRLLKYRAIAELFCYKAGDAARSAQAALDAGLSGRDAALARSVQAIALLSENAAQLTAVKPLAQQALQEASGDVVADLAARAAYALALRAEVDAARSAGADATAVLDEIAQVLGPIYGEGAPTACEPQEAWCGKFWRLGLAVLVDSGILATEEGDLSGEAQALANLQRLCPEDVWACYFDIPEKALNAARSVQPVAGAIDDHVRVAMYVATGYLYITTGDRLHGDALFRKAIEAYGRLLEDYDGWAGEKGYTVTPLGRFKIVGKEFYTYRNRMERLAKYCGDWWGIRVVRGDLSLGEALRACDHKLFRAIVRVRADRETNPIRMLHEERIRPVDYLTVWDWFVKRPYAPQQDWELGRAAVIEKVGQQEIRADQAVRQALKLKSEKKLTEALDVLQSALKPEPTLAETRIALRLFMADILMPLQRYGEVLALMEQAEAAMYEGDAYLGSDAIRYKGLIGRNRVLAAFEMGDIRTAIQAAEEIVADEEIREELRHRMLLQIVVCYCRLLDREGALDAYTRLANMVSENPSAERYRQYCLRSAEGYLRQAGFLEEEVQKSSGVSSSSSGDAGQDGSCCTE